MRDVSQTIAGADLGVVQLAAREGRRLVVGARHDDEATVLLGRVFESGGVEHIGQADALAVPEVHVARAVFLEVVGREAADRLGADHVDRIQPLRGGGRLCRGGHEGRRVHIARNGEGNVGRQHGGSGGARRQRVGRRDVIIAHEQGRQARQFAQRRIGVVACDDGHLAFAVRQRGAVLLVGDDGLGAVRAAHEFGEREHRVMRIGIGGDHDRGHAEGAGVVVGGPELGRADHDIGERIAFVGVAADRDRDRIFDARKSRRVVHQAFESIDRDARLGHEVRLGAADRTRHRGVGRRVERGAGVGGHQRDAARGRDRERGRRRVIDGRRVAAATAATGERSRAGNGK